jgi:uncharacterized protein (DUF1778 family)
MFAFKDVSAEIDEPNDARIELRTTTIADSKRTLLQPGDYAAFFVALDNPQEPKHSLKAAFKRHGETVVSK